MYNNSLFKVKKNL